METIIISDTNDLQQAAEILRQGGLVASPTETVYGLGGDALNPESSKKIYTAKEREHNKPLILLISDKKMFRKEVRKTGGKVGLALIIFF